MSDYVRRLSRPDRPLLTRLAMLDIELTERCDNDCIHCCINLPAGDAEATSRELSTAQWKGILDEAAELGCLQVRLTGGEPLLRPDFEDLYLHARRLGMRVLLFTNARQLGVGTEDGRGARLAALLARVPPLVPVEVSVYGMRPSSYEAVSRRGGSFAQFRRGIDRLVEHGVPIIVKGVVLPPTRGEMDEFEAWAAALSGSPTAGTTARPGYVVQFELRSRRDDPAANERIAALRLAPTEVVEIMARDEAAYREGKAAFAAGYMGPPGDRLFRCGAGRAVSVDAYGRVQPCMSLRAPQFAVSLIDAGPAAASAVSLAGAMDRFEALRDVRATNPEYIRRCARCFLHGLCEQCPGRSWSEHGTVDTPVEYLCDVAHAQARFLGWLEDDEKAWNVEEWSKRVG